MPTFYLTNILGLLMLLTTTPKHLGWTEDTLDDAFAPGLNVGLTVFGMNSWLSPFYGIPGVLPLNAVTWTITTMIFFYMVFPCLLPRLKRLQNYESCLAIMYWVQFSLWIVCPIVHWICIAPFVCDHAPAQAGEPWEGCPHGFDQSGYWFARAFPLSRLPVFVAGCVAALHRIRDDTGGSKASAAHGLPTLPKPHVAKGIFCCDCCCATECCVGGTEKDWSTRADCSIIGYAMVVVVCVISRPLDIGTRAVLEMAVPFLQLAGILAVTRDGGASYSSRFLRSRPMQFLGEISMSFYMIHMLVFLMLLYPLGQVEQLSKQSWVDAASSLQTVGGQICEADGPHNVTIEGSVNMVLYGCAPPASFDDAVEFCSARGGQLAPMLSCEEVLAMDTLTLHDYSGLPRREMSPSETCIMTGREGDECTVWTGRHKPVGCSDETCWTLAGQPEELMPVTGEMFAVDNYGGSEDVIKFVSQDTGLEWWPGIQEPCTNRCYDFGARTDENNKASIACVFDAASSNHTHMCDCALDIGDEIGKMPPWGALVSLVVTFAVGWGLTKMFENPVGKQLRYKVKERAASPISVSRPEP
jgi:peptidoglycan/LPS O-acetylase OafA/YrhL